MLLTRVNNPDRSQGDAASQWGLHFTVENVFHPVTGGDMLDDYSFFRNPH
jgi:hypothetical protein